MTAPLQATLQAGARELGIELNAEQANRLLAYVDLLVRWNRTYNLTAIRNADDMVTHHLLDCLAVVPPLQRKLDASARVLDVGSGGGLPGIVLALLNPGWFVHCVDTVGKKAAFIRQVGAELGLPNLTAHHARVETLKEASFDLITARAFASLADLVRLTRPLLAPHGCWAAMKGLLPTDEMAALAGCAEVFHVEPLRVPGLDADRCLVWMR